MERYHWSWTMKNIGSEHVKTKIYMFVEDVEEQAGWWVKLVSYLVKLVGDWRH